MIKNKKEISSMRRVCRLTAETLSMIKKYIEPGITTEEIDRICFEYIVKELNAYPSCLGYKGFPKSICTSVNNVICHGIPDSYKLKDGDIVNIDITVNKFGFHGDSSIMVAVGNVSDEAKKIIEVSRKALDIGIKTSGPGVSFKTLGENIQDYIESEGFSVVRDYTGHGIGRNFHESPMVFHCRHPFLQDIVMRPGMIFTIEPMVNAGSHEWVLLDDGWTVITKDKSLSSQWEHTILITKQGVDVLTERKDDSS